MLASPVLAVTSALGGSSSVRSLVFAINRLRPDDGLRSEERHARLAATHEYDETEEDLAAIAAIAETVRLRLAPFMREPTRKERQHIRQVGKAHAKKRGRAVVRQTVTVRDIPAGAATPAAFASAWSKATSFRGAVTVHRQIDRLLKTPRAIPRRVIASGLDGK